MVLLILYLVSVEDYVYDDVTLQKVNKVNAGIITYLQKLTWWYPTVDQNFNNRYVVYNYGQNNAQLPMGNWYTALTLILLEQLGLIH